MRMSTALTLVALLAVALPAQALEALPAQALDPDYAKNTVAGVCAACHGVDGNSLAPDFPRLAGQHPDYMAKALRDYKSGRRKNAIMAAFAQPLTPAQIDALAAYFATQPAVVVDKY